MSTEEALDSPNLELQVIVSSLIWMLGIKLACSEEWLVFLTAKPSF